MSIYRKRMPVRLSLLALGVISAVLLLSGLSFTSTGQAQADPEPLEVQVEAADGLLLVGDYYAQAAPPAGGAPAVLLMHMYSSNRRAWRPLIPALLAAGYQVVSVDLRGHGASRGTRNWEAAITDVQTWLDWLRAQDGVDGLRVAVIGASVGSNLALVGCANDAGSEAACVTAIALSPGLDYYAVQPESALIEGLKDRSALLIASHRDTYSAESIEQMVASGTGEIGLRLYPGSLHGTDLFRDRLDSVTRLVIGWLDEHLQ